MNFDQKLKRHVAAELRIRKALVLIESAQNNLSSACAELSAICGANPEWKKAYKLSDACHNLWRTLAYKDHSRWVLDRDVE